MAQAWGYRQICVVPARVAGGRRKSESKRVGPDRGGPFKPSVGLSGAVLEAKRVPHSRPLLASLFLNRTSGRWWPIFAIRWQMWGCSGSGAVWFSTGHKIPPHTFPILLLDAGVEDYDIAGEEPCERLRPLSWLLWASALRSEASAAFCSGSKSNPRMCTL